MSPLALWRGLYAPEASQPPEQIGAILRPRMTRQPQPGEIANTIKEAIRATSNKRRVSPSFGRAHLRQFCQKSEMACAGAL